VFYWNIDIYALSFRTLDDDDHLPYTSSLVDLVTRYDFGTARLGLGASMIIVLVRISLFSNEMGVVIVFWYCLSYMMCYAPYSSTVQVGIEFPTKAFAWIVESQFLI